MPVRTRTTKIHQVLIYDEWQRHRDFLGVMETQLDEFVHDWQEDLNQKAEQLDERERDEFLHIYLDEQYDMQQHRTILMNSFFTASFALFEHQLTWRCDYVQRRQESPFSVKDLKGSLMQRAKSYLTRFDIQFPSNEPEWSEINKYQKVRNMIVHAGGYVSSGWDLYRFVDQNGIVKENWGELRLELNRAFCEKAANDFERFMLKVSRAIHSTGEKSKTVQPSAPCTADRTL